MNSELGPSKLSQLMHDMPSLNFVSTFAPERAKYESKEVWWVDYRFPLLTGSEAWYTIDGKLPGTGSLFDELSGLYKTRTIATSEHTPISPSNTSISFDGNYPDCLYTACVGISSHRQGVLDILQCKPTKSSLAEAIISNWNAVDLETEASERKMVVTALRSFDEWDQHPQGRALAGVPPVVLKKIGDAPKREAPRDVSPKHALMVFECLI